jgi:hypothetical protein
MAELTKLSDLKRRYARDPGGAARSSAALGGARRRAVAPAPDLRDHDAQVGGGAPGAGRRGGPRSPTSSAAGDRGGCRVAALGAAGQPSDLEQQGGHAGGVGDLGKAWLCAAQHVAIVVVFFLAVAREGQWPAVNFQRSKIRRGEGEDEVAWWDPRVRKVNRETAGVNCVLGMKTFLLHPQ